MAILRKSATGSLVVVPVALASTGISYSVVVAYRCIRSAVINRQKLSARIVAPAALLPRPLAGQRLGQTDTVQGQTGRAAWWLSRRPTDNSNKYNYYLVTVVQVLLELERQSLAHFTRHHTGVS